MYRKNITECFILIVKFIFYSIFNYINYHYYYIFNYIFNYYYHYYNYNYYYCICNRNLV